GDPVGEAAVGEDLPRYRDENDTRFDEPARRQEAVAPEGPPVTVPRSGRFPVQVEGAPDPIRREDVERLLLISAHGARRGRAGHPRDLAVDLLEQAAAAVQ